MFFLNNTRKFCTFNVFCLFQSVFWCNILIFLFCFNNSLLNQLLLVSKVLPKRGVAVFLNKK